MPFTPSLIQILRVIFAAVILAVAFFSADWHSVSAYFTRDFLLAILLATIPLLIGIGFITLRHSILVQQPRLAFGPTLQAVVLSFGFNLLLPGRIAELMKVTFLREKCGIQFTAGLSALFIERVIDMLLIGALGLFSVLMFTNDDSWVLYALFIGTSITLVISLPYMGKPMRFVADKIPSERFRNTAHQFTDDILQRLSARLIYRSSLIGIAAWALFIVAFSVFLSLASSQGLALHGVITLFVATVIGGSIPILPGGLGTFEAAAILVLQSFGYPFDAALALAIGLRLVHVIAVLPWSIWIATHHGTGIRSLISHVRSDAKTD